MSQENTVPQTEKETVNEELLEKVVDRGGIHISMYTKEQLIDLCTGLGQDLENCRRVRDSHYDTIIRINKERDTLRVALAEWRYACRVLFFKAIEAMAVMQTVRHNLEWQKGFTHHMKDVINSLNDTELQAGINGLVEPTDKTRELMRANNEMQDIPY